MVESRDEDDFEVRRITPWDGPLLRSLMLAAADPTHPIEHRAFLGDPDDKWDRLALERATDRRRAIFVLVRSDDDVGLGLLWCFLDSHRLDTAEVTWRWTHPEARGRRAESALFHEAAQWSGSHGRVRLIAAAHDQDDVDLLERVKFARVGVAQDRLRPLFTRQT